jgi:hypothetical protein
MPHYVVYNPIDEKFDIVAYFSKKCDGHRQIGLMDEHEDGFIRKNKIIINMGEINECVGYPWIIEDASVLKDIEQENQIDEKFVTLAKEMNASINPSKWNEVTNEYEAENLMNHTGGFHDWYLISITAISNPYTCEQEATLQLKFNSQAAFDTILEFEGSIDINFSFEMYNRIYSSSVIFKDGRVYWVDNDEFDLECIRKYNYISAKKLRWKFILKEENDW